MTEGSSHTFVEIIDLTLPVPEEGGKGLRQDDLIFDPNPTPGSPNNFMSLLGPGPRHRRHVSYIPVSDQ